MLTRTWPMNWRLGSSDTVRRSDSTDFGGVAVRDNPELNKSLRPDRPGLAVLPDTSARGLHPVKPRQRWVTRTIASRRPVIEAVEGCPAPACAMKSIAARPARQGLIIHSGTSAGPASEPIARRRQKKVQTGVLSLWLSQHRLYGWFAGLVAARPRRRRRAATSYGHRRRRIPPQPERSPPPYRRPPPPKPPHVEDAPP